MMNDSQLAFMYVFIGVLATLIFVMLESILNERDVQVNHADKLCQELYGPQSGALWEGNTLKCQTARGDMLPLREPK
jgi:hypothetical protein